MSDRYRYSINVAEKRIDLHTPDGETTAVYDLNESPEKVLALAFLGVKQYINQNVTRLRGRNADWHPDNRVDAIRQVAIQLQNKTADAMTQRGRPRLDTGPRILKRDRIAALAAIKGCTVTALTEALSRVDDATAEAALHSAAVESYIAQQDVAEATV